MLILMFVFLYMPILSFIIRTVYIIVDSAPSSNLAMHATFIIPNP